MNKKERAKSVEKIVRLSYDSLQSHLFYTYSKSPEGEKFHKQAIVDYLKIMAEALRLW